MTVREVLLCDIPDDYQPVAKFLEDIGASYPEISFEILLGAIEDLKYFGPIASECLPTVDGM